MLILCYVSLDLSSPFVPGAFNFDADESVEGVQRHRDRCVIQFVVGPAAPVTSPPDAGGLGDPPRRLAREERPTPGLAEWLVDLRRAHTPMPEVSSLSEEH